MLRKIYGPQPRWIVDDKDVSEEEWERVSKERKLGQDGFCTNFRMDVDHSVENRGRGRKSVQMMRHKDDDGDHCYFRNTEELREKAKLADYGVTDL